MKDTPAIEKPTITFERRETGTIDARGILESIPGGLTFRIHEEWRADEHIVTLERQGLQVSFRASLFHIECMAESLAEYVKRARQPRPGNQPRTERQGN